MLHSLLSWCDTTSLHSSFFLRTLFYKNVMLAEKCLMNMAEERRRTFILNAAAQKHGVIICFSAYVGRCNITYIVLCMYNFVLNLFYKLLYFVLVGQGNSQS